MWYQCIQSWIRTHCDEIYAAITARLCKPRHSASVTVMCNNSTSQTTNTLYSAEADESRNSYLQLSLWQTFFFKMSCFCTDVFIGDMEHIWQIKNDEFLKR